MALRLLTLVEVAQRLNMSLATVRSWASERRLPLVKLGRRCLVDEAALDKWIEAHRCAVRDPLVDARRRPAM